jgi:hypothetical protein
MSDYYYHQIENRLYVYPPINTDPKPDLVATDFGLYEVFDTNQIDGNAYQAIIDYAAGRIGPDTDWEGDDLEILEGVDADEFGK